MKVYCHGIENASLSYVVSVQHSN